MTLLYYDPVFQEHKTGRHPENPDRLLPTVRHLNFVALDAACRRPSWQPASAQRLELVHSVEYIQQVKELAESGGGQIEADTVLSPASFDVASKATGAVCDAVERIHRNEDKTAFCLVRPPGHHALPDQAMGFCLFNHVAIGARVATQELGFERVMIVDWDVHHGNGTQAVFWEDAAVAYYSMHRSPFYPYTGQANETGGGQGAGTICNVPVTVGTPREQQLETFEQTLSDFAEKFKPQLIFISAGFDSHKDDPIGSLGLHSNDFTTITKLVKRIAHQHADNRIISVLEGGYNPIALAECVTCHLEELLQKPDDQPREQS